MWQLLNAFSAEQQAIALYEAQVFWRPGESSSLFRQVLAEERAHRLSIEEFLGRTTSIKIVTTMITPINILMGWVFGCVLSILPRKLCYRIHVWAEEEAAKTYDQTAKLIPSDSPPHLRAALVHASAQERLHARLFEALLKDLK